MERQSKERRSVNRVLPTRTCRRGSYTCGMCLGVDEPSALVGRAARVERFDLRDGPTMDCDGRRAATNALGTDPNCVLGCGTQGHMCDDLSA